MPLRRSRSTYLALALATLLSLLSALSACVPPPAATVQGVSAQDVWARAAKTMDMGEAMPAATEESQMAMGQDSQMQHGGANSAVYMVLVNNSAAADRLVAAQVDVSNVVEIHETKMEGDVMRMAPVEGGIEIPAGGQVVLKPGGYHVMLIGLKQDLNAGDTFPVTLQFQSGKTLIVEAEVRQP